jgi:hypothetical protein
MKVERKATFRTSLGRITVVEGPKKHYLEHEENLEAWQRG